MNLPLANALKTTTLRVGLLACLGGLGALAPAQQDNPLTRSMGITQHLGQNVPKDLPLKNEDGKVVTFGSLLQGRPVVVVPIFYGCRTACAIVTDNIMKTLAKSAKVGKDNKLVVGRDFDIVMVSLHPKETHELAYSKKQLILNALTPPKGLAQEGVDAWRNQTSKAWHLMTADKPVIDRLVTKTLGVQYSYNPEKNLINHPTCTVFLTPSGKISGYTIGNDFPTKVVQTSLDAAASEQVSVKADQMRMFGCIMIDPATGKYRVVIYNVMRLAGILTILTMAAWIIGMSVKTKRDNPYSGGDPSVR